MLIPTEYWENALNRDTSSLYSADLGQEESSNGQGDGQIGQDGQADREWFPANLTVTIVQGRREEMSQDR